MRKRRRWRRTLCLVGLRSLGFEKSWVFKRIIDAVMSLSDSRTKGASLQNALHFIASTTARFSSCSCEISSSSALLCHSTSRIIGALMSLADSSIKGVLALKCLRFLPQVTNLIVQAPRSRSVAP